MHIRLKFNFSRNFEIPTHYNELIQAAIYDSIDPDLAKFLHDQGYQSGNRIFKLFAFSKLIGRFEILKEKHCIMFKDEVELIISSPVPEFCQSIANGILSKGRMRLGTACLEIKKIEIQNEIIQDDKVLVNTLSPVVTYSTLFRPDRRKYTCYFQPGDPDFDQLIENNLRKKFTSYYQQEAPQGEIKVRKIGKGDMRIVSYKDTVIKGYTGKLLLTGPRELLQMAVDGGLGGKNSQGFGCIEVIERR